MATRDREGLEALWFLRALFGDTCASGWLLVWGKRGRRSRWFRADEAGLKAAARLIRSSSSDFYVGVGLRHKPLGQHKRGKARDIRVLPGLWLDIDVRDPVAHRKTRLPETRAAARALLGDFELAPSVVVDSGHGLHAWWLFDAPWVLDTREQWEHAVGLSVAFQSMWKRLARQRGYDLDSLPQLDCVLRCPGSRNWKDSDAPRPVSLASVTWVTSIAAPQLASAIGEQKGTVRASGTSMNTVRVSGASMDSSRIASADRFEDNAEITELQDEGEELKFDKNHELPTGVADVQKVDGAGDNVGDGDGKANSSDTYGVGDLLSVADGVTDAASRSTRGTQGADDDSQHVFRLQIRTCDLMRDKIAAVVGGAGHEKIVSPRTPPARYALGRLDASVQRERSLSKKRKQGRDVAVDRRRHVQELLHEQPDAGVVGDVGHVRGARAQNRPPHGVGGHDRAGAGTRTPVHRRRTRERHRTSPRHRRAAWSRWAPTRPSRVYASRSEAVFAYITARIRAGDHSDDIARALLDRSNALSERFYERADPERFAREEIARAQRCVSRTYTGNTPRRTGTAGTSTTDTTRTKGCMGKTTSTSGATTTRSSIGEGVQDDIHRLARGDRRALEAFEAFMRRDVPQQVDIEQAEQLLTEQFDRAEHAAAPLVTLGGPCGLGKSAVAVRAAARRRAAGRHTGVVTPTNKLGEELTGRISVSSPAASVSSRPASGSSRADPLELGSATAQSPAPVPHDGGMERDGVKRDEVEQGGGDVAAGDAPRVARGVGADQRPEASQVRTGADLRCGASEVAADVPAGSVLGSGTVDLTAVVGVAGADDRGDETIREGMRRSISAPESGLMEAFGGVVRWYGPGSLVGEDGELVCRYPDSAREVARAGLSMKATMCRRCSWRSSCPAAAGETWAVASSPTTSLKESEPTRPRRSGRSSKKRTTEKKPAAVVVTNQKLVGKLLDGLGEDDLLVIDEMPPLFEHEELGGRDLRALIESIEAGDFVAEFSALVRPMVQVWARTCRLIEDRWRRGLGVEGVVLAKVVQEAGEQLDRDALHRADVLEGLRTALDITGEEATDAEAPYWEGVLGARGRIQGGDSLHAGSNQTMVEANPVPEDAKVTSRYLGQAKKMTLSGSTELQRRPKGPGASPEGALTTASTLQTAPGRQVAREHRQDQRPRAATKDLAAAEASRDVSSAAWRTKKCEHASPDELFHLASTLWPRLEDALDQRRMVHLRHEAPGVNVMARRVRLATRALRVLRAAINAKESLRSRARIADRHRRAGRRHKPAVVVTEQRADIVRALSREGPTVVMDAFAHAYAPMLQRVTGRAVDVQRVDVPDGAPVERVFTYAAHASKRALTVHKRTTAWGRFAPKLMHALKRAMKRDARSILVVTHKVIADDLRHHLLMQRPIPHEGLEFLIKQCVAGGYTLDVGHFGAMRGLDRWRYTDCIITIGDPWPNLTDVRTELGLAGLGEGDHSDQIEQLVAVELAHAHGRGRAPRRRRPLLALHYGQIAPAGWHSKNCTLARLPLGRSIPRGMGGDELREALASFDRIQDLAQMIGRSARQVRNYRSGASTISPEVAERIRQAVAARMESTAGGGEGVSRQRRGGQARPSPSSTSVRSPPPPTPEPPAEMRAPLLLGEEGGFPPAAVPSSFERRAEGSECSGGSGGQIDDRGASERGGDDEGVGVKRRGGCKIKPLWPP